MAIPAFRDCANEVSAALDRSRIGRYRNRVDLRRIRLVESGRCYCVNGADCQNDKDEEARHDIARPLKNLLHHSAPGLSFAVLSAVNNLRYQVVELNPSNVAGFACY